MLQCGNSKLQNDSESPQKTNSMSVQLKTRWHLLEIVWLTATSLLLSSQLDTRLSLKTWLTQRQLYWKMQLVPTVLISVFSVEFHWRRVCVNLCPTPPSVGALWAFLLQTASKLAGCCWGVTLRTRIITSTATIVAVQSLRVEMCGAETEPATPKNPFVEI